MGPGPSNTFYFFSLLLHTRSCGWFSQNCLSLMWHERKGSRSRVGWFWWGASACQSRHHFLHSSLGEVMTYVSNDENATPTYLHTRFSASGVLGGPRHEL